MASTNYRIGIDIGGTFTDIALVDETGTVEIRKVASTPDDYSRGIAIGLKAMIEDLKIDPKNIPSLHGLTLLSFETDDFVRAAELIKQIEGVEPDYSALPGLRSRLQAERGAR